MKLRILQIFQCMFLLLAITIPHAADALAGQTDVVVGPVGRKLDSYFTRITPYGFSGVVLVAHGDTVVLNKGYGMANREENIPNSSETVMSVGSITKQFTAAAIMTLEMQGKLKTSDPIGKFLEGVPADKSSITIHHLLTHTSGLVPDVGGDYEPSPRDETVGKILALPLESVPGERFAYSNVNYSLLAAVVEHVSGESYEGYLQAHLFKPAGMQWTGYHVPEWNQRSVAHWYTGEKDNNNALSRPFPYWNLIGNGGILSTSGDLLLWHRALKGNAILSDAAKAKLFKPFLNDYAYGWDVLKTSRGTLIQHNGGSELGNNAEIRRYMDANIVTVLLCNQHYHGRPLVDAVRRKLEKLAFGEKVIDPPATLPSDSAEIGILQGVYTLSPGDQFLVSSGQDGLTIRAQGEGATDLLAFPDGNDAVLHRKLSDTSVAILRAALAGNTTLLEGVMEHAGERLPRVKDLLVKRAGENLIGRIREITSYGTVPSEMEDGAVETHINLEGEDGSVNLRLIWRGMKNIGVGPLDIIAPVSLSFLPTSTGEFAGYDLGSGSVVAVKFARGQNGKVDSMTFPRTKTRIEARRQE